MRRPPAKLLLVSSPTTTLIPAGGVDTRPAALREVNPFQEYSIPKSANWPMQEQTPVSIEDSMKDSLFDITVGIAVVAGANDSTTLTTALLQRHLGFN